MDFRRIYCAINTPTIGNRKRRGQTPTNKERDKHDTSESKQANKQEAKVVALVLVFGFLFLAN